MTNDFVLDDVTRSLARTPSVLRALLTDLPERWIHSNEGPGTWSPFDVVGHLIHGEKTDWIPRARHFLAGHVDVPFPPFDRDAQLRDSQGNGLAGLLDELQDLRAQNVDTLIGFGLTEADLDRMSTHPELGPVSLRQHLATWVTHDFSHLGQIARVLAKRHAEAVGPWARYLSILRR
jgi:hypothetical protein